MDTIKQILNEEYNRDQFRAESTMLELQKLKKQNEELKTELIDTLTALESATEWLFTYRAIDKTKYINVIDSIDERKTELTTGVKD